MNGIKPKQYLWQLKWLDNSYKFNPIKELNPSIDLSPSDITENNWHNAYLYY